MDILNWMKKYYKIEKERINKVVEENGSKLW